ncbi:MAG: hypothetical protein WC180_03585 [Candidatus Paceibacterota bacterium]
MKRKEIVEFGVTKESGVEVPEVPTLLIPVEWEPLTLEIDFQLVEGWFRFPHGIDQEEIKKIYRLIMEEVNATRSDHVLPVPLQKRANTKFGMPKSDFNKIIDFMGPNDSTGGIGILYRSSSVLSIDRGSFFFKGYI